MESNDRAIGHIVGTIALFFVLKFSDLSIDIKVLGAFLFIFLLFRTAIVCEEAENENLKGIGQMLFMGIMTLAVISEIFNFRNF